MTRVKLDGQTRLEVGVDRGVETLAIEINEALRTQGGRAHVSGKGHGTGAETLDALRRLAATAGIPSLAARDPNGSVAGIHRASRNGTVVSSRSKNTKRRWHLYVYALPPDFSVELPDIGGTAPLPPAAASVSLGDVVEPDPEGPGVTYYFGIRLAFDGPAD